MAVKGFIPACLLFCLLFSSSCQRNHDQFTALPASKTNIDFENVPEKRELLSILYYLYYYNGGGVSAGDINNDGLTDLYFTANSNGHNKLYLNKGNFEFEDITTKAGVAGSSDWCTGVTMADINGDGFLDIYVSAFSKAHGLEGRNELFINNKDNSFTESAIDYGLDFSGFSTQAAFFDYDHDGDLDCYLLNQSQKPNQNIVDTSNRRKINVDEGDRMYRNELITANDGGSKKFTDVSKAANIYQSNLGYGLGLSIADFNNDGWDDVYVGNDFHENDYYYINKGDGSFSEEGVKHFNHYSRFSMGNDAADYNNDGQLDLVTVDMLPDNEKVLKTYGSDENADIYKLKLIKNGFQYQVSRNTLQRNNGDGKTFSDEALLAGMYATDWSWSPLFADFDNDGNKDLFISSGIVKRPVDLDYIRFASDLYTKKQFNKTNKYDEDALAAMPDGSSHPFLFKGNGDAQFQDFSKTWGTGEMKGYYNGAAYADLDNDGRLDLVINALNQEAVVLQNNLPKQNAISISFIGKNANTKGIGAKAYVFYNDRMQYQQLMLTRGFMSSSDARLHFGLNQNTTVDSILVLWPDQQYQVLKNVPANKPLVVDHKNASGKFGYNDFFKPPSEAMTRQNDLVSWRHRENAFEDFNNQYLIPHAESTRGPKIATADVNQDGLEDLYVCGAKDQAGALLIRQKNGGYQSADTAVFNKAKTSEEVDVLFFDANNDGHPDLYVVSGGNEYYGSNPALLDKLYINDGKGKFFPAENALPQAFENKSCVTAGDIDKDGDLDLFIGTLADSKAYGIPQTSYLLLNDGKGNFSVADPGTISLTDIGMVTSAQFADMNRDGWGDLIVAGEWMPLVVFINEKGKFRKEEVPGSTGLWQTIFVDDVNKDGSPDILGGNWGWNSKLWSGKNGPLKLYVSDYDKNGQTDQLMSYTLDGREYPFLAKDEVERSLPLLKKHYLKYGEYAGVEMKDVFYGWVDSIKPIQAERLGSAIFYGNGKGGFQITDLPADLQLAPVMCFQKMKNGSAGPDIYFAGGNFFDVIPYEGQYDAQALGAFRYEDGKIEVSHDRFNPMFKSQVRDLQWLKITSTDSVLAVAANDDSLRLFRINSPVLFH